MKIHFLSMMAATFGRWMRALRKYVAAALTLGYSTHRGATRPTFGGVAAIDFQEFDRRVLPGILLLILAAAPVHAELPAIPRPVFTKVAQGLDYAHVSVSDSNFPVSVHLARLERRESPYRIISSLSNEKVVGLSTLAQQIKSLPATKGTPVAGVNGDFFVIAKGPYQGDPHGLQIMDGELVSSANGPAIWFGPRGWPHIAVVTSGLGVSLPGDMRFDCGLNERRETNGAALYTPTFGSSTRTTNGCEFVLGRRGNRPWLPLRAGRVYSAEISEIRHAADTEIGTNSIVLSFAPEITNRLAKLKVGDVVHIRTASAPGLGDAVNAIGGRPILVQHGVEQTWKAPPGTNSTGLPRHPRTAAGWNSRYFFLMVVDGRQKELSMGMTFPELAHYMKSIGCTEAMNLDGGGSTTFWLEGKVRNSPSDKRERSLANGLIIVRKAGVAGFPVLSRGHE